MWDIDRVLEANASYERIDSSQWRASITGIVTAAAVAATPFQCQMQLKRAVGFVLSRAVLGVGPFTYQSDGTTASLAPRLEKLLVAEAEDVAVSAPSTIPGAPTSSKPA